MKKKYGHLAFEERYVIEVMYRAGSLIRCIAEFLDRSPNTISREITKHSVNGEYLAKKACHKAYALRWRAKRQCLKVALDGFLTTFVMEKLQKKWSPKQISGYLKRELGITCSAKSIYKFAESRGLERLLFWGWNKQKGGRKRGHWHAAHDGRKYIEARPALDGLGHWEVDFIVSKDSAWVLLVAIDRVGQKVLIKKLPNRKRTTIRDAFRVLFSGLQVKSITTDNDIAFTGWRELEVLLNTTIYFTHPYHSWEKGLVENANRWIRCFVPKRRDIGTVSEIEIREILEFLNERPKAVLGFVSSKRYYESLTCCPT